MLPFTEIWDQILKIQESYTTKINLNTKIEDFDEELIQNLIDEKNNFYLETDQYAAAIAQMMEIHENNGAVDYSYRYKEDFSIEDKCLRHNAVDMTKQIYKIANDFLGMRFIIKADPEKLFQIAEEFINRCPLTNVCSLVDQREGKKNDDGYKGIHIYIRTDSNTFQIEVQFWTRTHCLLNEYLHDNIYKITEEDFTEYALDLRNWLESVPRLAQDSGIMNYVDYVYERMD